MASASITTYKNNTQTYVYTLVSQSADTTVWKIANRTLGEPMTLSLQRKVGPTGSKTNDHIILRSSRTDKNATTGLPATCSITLDVSIPRDNSIITAQAQTDLLQSVASIINEYAANAATQVNAGKIVGATDL